MNNIILKANTKSKRSETCVSKKMLGDKGKTTKNQRFWCKQILKIKMNNYLKYLNIVIFINLCNFSLYVSNMCVVNLSAN
jgi:hypothetical protein